MKHLYGIVPNRPEFVINSVVMGVAGEPVQTIAHGGLVALVSDAHHADYTHLYKPNLVQMLADHQQVSERVMPLVSSLLPVKFGTLLKTEEVQALLERHHTALQPALDTLTDKVEVEVVMTWELEKVFAQIAQAPQISQLRAEMATKSPAEAQALQIKAGQVVQSTLEAYRDTLQKQIVSSLSTVADDVEINPTHNEQVVANVAFLLPAEKQAAFDAQVELLDAQLEGQYNFKIVGPLPAYSFNTVEILKIAPTEIAEARTLLQIGESFTADELRTAYHRQSPLVHPDLATDDPQAEERFAALQDAYQLLQLCLSIQAKPIQPVLAGGDIMDGATVDAAPLMNGFHTNLCPTVTADLLLVTICRSSELTE